MRTTVFQVVSHLVGGPLDENGGRFPVGQADDEWHTEDEALAAAIAYAQKTFVAWGRKYQVTVERREVATVYDTGTPEPAPQAWCESGTVSKTCPGCARCGGHSPKARA